VKITRSHLRKIIKEELSRTLLSEGANETIVSKLTPMVQGINSRYNDWSFQYETLSDTAVTYDVVIDVSKKIPKIHDPVSQHDITPEETTEMTYGYTITVVDAINGENSDLTDLVTSGIDGLLDDPEFVGALDIKNAAGEQSFTLPLQFAPATFRRRTETEY
tara:strand:- start:2592 stop:3077 length:486 start_codon:yes stop_codon:yes gene_type:complete